MRPRIGLTGSVMPLAVGTRRTFLNEPYLVAIQEAGGVPIVVTPAHTGPALAAVYELLDGLVLTGGEVVAERDTLEFTLLEWALRDDLPILAICRGLQLLNVALGGTLYQDLPSERPVPLGHNQMLAERPRTDPHHPVTLTPGSALADVLGQDRVEVNSLHHQGIKRLAPCLTAVAHAPDDLVEGVEPTDPTGRSFLIGVQWHPEELARAGDVPSRRLFERFVAAAAKRAAR